MRQRTLLIALAASAIVAVAGIVIVLQPGDKTQRQQQGFTVFRGPLEVWRRKSSE